MQIIADVLKHEEEQPCDVGLRCANPTYTDFGQPDTPTRHGFTPTTFELCIKALRSDNFGHNIPTSGHIGLMDDRLLKKYLEYASTDEAFAVLFVKKHLTQANGHWVDIIDCQRYEMSSDNLHFRFVVGGLYKRKIQPQYPSKSAFTIDGEFDERRYYLMVRAITWEVAHRDMEQQKSKKVAATKFKITGVSFDRNRDNKNYFRDDAPPEIKALSDNLYDRTNPLWDKAMQYINKPEFVYKIKQVSIIEPGAKPITPRGAAR